LIPIFLATVAVRQQSPRIIFNGAAEMLDAFGLQQGGSQYRRLIASFQRIFGATIFFGTDTQLKRTAVVHRARFNFMTEARIWYSRNPEEKLLGGECQNMILLSDEFYREVLNHPIPTDLEAAKALSSCPAALDLFMWLSYRCFTARGRERVPLFGAFGPPTLERRIRPSTKVPRETAGLAGNRPGDVAGVPGFYRSGWNGSASRPSLRRPAIAHARDFHQLLSFTIQGSPDRRRSQSG
jgi:hypothetical protein